VTWRAVRRQERAGSGRDAPGSGVELEVQLHYRRIVQRRIRGMPRSSQHPKDASFNLRIDPALKAAFTAATAAVDKPAAQVLRDFMRAYVKLRERRAFDAEARRQSLAIAERARDPAGDEHAIMREIAAELDRDDFADAWKA
jgi:hypothetical protein